MAGDALLAGRRWRLTSGAFQALALMCARAQRVCAVIACAACCTPLAKLCCSPAAPHCPLCTQPGCFIRAVRFLALYANSSSCVPFPRAAAPTHHGAACSAETGAARAQTGP